MEKLPQQPQSESQEILAEAERLMAKIEGEDGDIVDLDRTNDEMKKVLPDLIITVPITEAEDLKGILGDLELHLENLSPDEQKRATDLILRAKIYLSGRYVKDGKHLEKVAHVDLLKVMSEEELRRKLASAKYKLLPPEGK